MYRSQSRPAPQGSNRKELVLEQCFYILFEYDWPISFVHFSGFLKRFLCNYMYATLQEREVPGIQLLYTAAMVHRVARKKVGGGGGGEGVIRESERCSPFHLLQPPLFFLAFLSPLCIQSRLCLLTERQKQVILLLSVLAELLFTRSS